MSYRMYRVFCATPGDSEADLENERQAFYEVVGQLNESEAMPLGILFVPVSVVPNLTNISVFQRSVDENVRACKFFVQVLDHTWGPETRSFEHCYQLATQCCAGVSLLFKVPNGRQIEPKVAALRVSHHPRVIDFEGIDDFKIRLRSQLSVWLGSIENS
jgi:hypothetical protein